MRRFEIDEIERIFLSQSTPEAFKDAMNSLLVDHSGFRNSDKTGYIMSYFKDEIEDFDPFTTHKPPARIKSPSRDVISLKSEYKELASDGLEPKYIIIKTVHRKGADNVITFINSGTFRDFSNVNYRMPSVKDSVKVVSTKSFGNVSGMLTRPNIEVKFMEKAKERYTTPLNVAFDEGYVCMLPSGKIQMSPIQILNAAKKSIQNPYEIVQ
jgi:hypothetical protein